jgi:hypothetical protein
MGKRAFFTNIFLTRPLAITVKSGCHYFSIHPNAPQQNLVTESNLLPGSNLLQVFEWFELLLRDGRLRISLITQGGGHA